MRSTTYTNSAASREFKVDRRRVQDWHKNESELKEIHHPSLHCCKPGGGRKLKFAAIDEKLLTWFRKRRDKGMPITGTALKHDTFCARLLIKRKNEKTKLRESFTEHNSHALLLSKRAYWFLQNFL